MIKGITLVNPIAVKTKNHLHTRVAPMSPFVKKITIKRAAKARPVAKRKRNKISSFVVVIIQQNNFKQKGHPCRMAFLIGKFSNSIIE